MEAHRRRGVPREVRARVVDRNAPGQRRLRAEEFLVEEVAPSADGLAEQEGGRADVEPAQRADGLAPSGAGAPIDPPDVDHERERRPRYRAEYPDPAGAEREYLQRIPAIETPQINDVVEAGADEPERRADHGDVQNVIRILPETLRLAVRQDNARDEPGEDHHGVEANVRPENDDALKTDVELHCVSLPLFDWGASRV